MNEPLLLEPGFGARLVSVLGRKLLGEQFTGLGLHTELGIPTDEERPKRERVGKIAVIPIVGVIDHRPQSMGTSTQEIGGMIDQALGDSDIVGIVYDVDSPGGTVTGVPETAQKIREAAKVKPSISIANGLMASAGYWLGAAVGKGNVWMLGSGEGPGSIGVWTAHEDWSKWYEDNGIKVTAVSAGKYKLEGAPWSPLTEESQEFLQARVDEVYKAFLANVAEDRQDTAANVRSGYGQARVLPPKLAKEANLGDKVGTLEEAVDWLARKASPRTRGAKASLLTQDLEMQAARLVG
jgi:signal peptide peptidase SppA